MDEEQIDLPAEVLVRCPKVEFQMARITGCASCEFFRGVADRFPGTAMPFERRYLVLCHAEPMKRELFRLA